MALSNKERQAKYLALSSDRGCGRLQTLLSAASLERLNDIQNEMGWTKRQIVEAAIAQLFEYLSSTT
ncbi:hypothetical protein [Acidithiobacillus ferrivorans]|nr:hypothetical protein [Acidithiobacillus ferrivorans]